MLIEDGRGDLNLVIILLQEKKRVLLGTCNAWSTVEVNPCTCTHDVSSASQFMFNVFLISNITTPVCNL